MTLNLRDIGRRLVGGLLVRDGTILLGKRSVAKRAWAGTWDMPGGHVKKWEGYEDALLREIEEEIAIRPQRFSLIADWLSEEGEPYRIYLIDGWTGGEPILNNHEHSELHWFNIDEASKIAPLADRRYPALFRSLIEASDR